MKIAVACDHGGSVSYTHLVAVYGGNDGVRFEQEKKGLTLGADVVIATPGLSLIHIQMCIRDRTFHYVTDIKEVLALALTNEKVNDAIDFNITNQKTEEKK